jgi:hypothetical protein
MSCFTRTWFMIMMIRLCTDVHLLISFFLISLLRRLLHMNMNMNMRMLCICKCCSAEIYQISSTSSKLQALTNNSPKACLIYLIIGVRRGGGNNEH